MRLKFMLGHKFRQVMERRLYRECKPGWSAIDHPHEFKLYNFFFYALRNKEDKV